MGIMLVRRAGSRREAAAPARLLWRSDAAGVGAETCRNFPRAGLRALLRRRGAVADLSRDLVFILNGLDEDTVASSDDPARIFIYPWRVSLWPDPK